ncbi:MAG: PilZ domain-containing protein [Bradyrhizobium sp.]
MRDRRDLGARKSVRVGLDKPGFLIPSPKAQWVGCQILDVSEDGACLDVGDLAVPKMFGLALTAGGEVRRICALVWRQGELVGVRFVSARELRQGVAPVDQPGKAMQKV